MRGRLPVICSADHRRLTVMTAPGPPPDQPREWLERAVGAIERGNWRHVRYQLNAAAAHGDLAAFSVLVRAVAIAMRFKALGDVAKAWKQLGVAAELLPPAMRRLPRDGITPVAVLRPEPTTGCRMQALTWRVARVIWREQAELAALQMSVVKHHDEPRILLIEAMIEWMRWVEFDPWTCALHRLDNLPGTGPTRAEFCGRATRLRRFAHPTAGDLSTTVWMNLDGYVGLREAALRRLAASELVPWRSANPLVVDIPVWLGRRRAWEYATQWLADL